MPEHLETVHKRAIFDMPYPGEMELEAPVGNSWKIQHVVKVKIPEKIRLVPADREQNRPGTNAFLTHDLTFLFNSLKTADNRFGRYSILIYYKLTIGNRREQYVRSFE